MRATKTLPLILLLLVSFTATAQEYNPFKSIGKKGKIVTLSKGKYVEVFDYDTIQRIGTVLFNIRTKKIVKLLDPEKTFEKFSDNSSTSRWYSPDPLSYKYFSYSPYNFVGNNPINNIDPDGREIIGVTKKDAKKAKEDILGIFKDDKYAGLRNLISLDKKGKTFNSIDSKALDAALKDANLNEDEKALVSLVTGTINSKDEHLIEYVSKDANLSKTGQDIMSKNLPSALVDPVIKANGGIPGSILSAFGGAGSTVKTDNGSYSVLIEGLDISKSGTDYYNSNTKAYGNNPAGRSATTGHEIFGHGRSLVLGRGASAQQADAIRTENLILRVMGYSNIQRDGTGHGNGTPVQNQSALPGY